MTKRVQLMVTVSKIPPQSEVKIWARHVNGCDLGKQGGFALSDGEWFRGAKNAIIDDSTTVTLYIDTDAKKLPYVVVGVAVISREGNPRPIEQAAIIVGDVGNGYRSAHSVLCLGKNTPQIEVVFPTGGRVVSTACLHRMDKMVYSYPIIKRDANKAFQKSPFYWAACYLAAYTKTPHKVTLPIAEKDSHYLDETFGVDHPMIETITTSEKAVSPLQLYSTPQVRMNGKTVNLPEGIKKIYEMSQVLIFGVVEQGQAKMAFMDWLLKNNDPRLSAEMIELLEDQAAKLEGLAMTYRIQAEGARQASTENPFVLKRSPTASPSPSEASESASPSPSEASESASLSPSDEPEDEW